MAYEVTIVATDGRQTVYRCAGANDEVALIYAGKVVEAHADRSDPDARISITRDGEAIGPASRVVEMITRAI